MLCVYYLWLPLIDPMHIKLLLTFDRWSISIALHAFYHNFMYCFFLFSVPARLACRGCLCCERMSACVNVYVTKAKTPRSIVMLDPHLSAKGKELTPCFKIDEKMKTRSANRIDSISHIHVSPGTVMRYVDATGSSDMHIAGDCRLRKCDLNEIGQ